MGLLQALGKLVGPHRCYMALSGTARAGRAMNQLDDVENQRQGLRRLPSKNDNVSK